APKVRLIVIKLQNQDDDPQGGSRLPGAIRTAVDHGAKVINLSIKAAPSKELLAAVQYAQRANVLIVAAAGNIDGSADDGTPAYPADYPGVLSVGSLGPDGQRADTSTLATRIDLAGPGKQVVTAWTGSGYTPGAEGTSFA